MSSAGGGGSITIGNYGYVTACLTVLQTFSIFANKYVLTVLGFQFPMVFQGWQTLVGFIVLKLMNSPRCCYYFYEVSPMDKSGFVSLLPNFLFFTTSIIAGSKALAQISVTVFITSTNAIAAAIHLFVDADKILTYSISIISSIFTLITGIIIFVYNSGGTPLSFGESPYFWLLVHLICNIALILHGRIADARYGPIDKLYFSYVFSLIVLAPASFYLEESFQALNFQHRKQIRFIVGSIFSAICGVALNLYLSHTHNKLNTSGHLLFPAPHHVGPVVAALFSIVVFSGQNGVEDHGGLYLPWWGWLAVILNLIFYLFVPSYLKPDEITDMTAKATTTSSSTRIVKPSSKDYTQDESMAELLIVP